MSDSLPTISSPVILSHICCPLFKGASVSAKRVSLALYFIDAFNILLQAYSVTGYILTLSRLSNIEATRSVYMCNSYTLRSHVLTFSPPLLSVGHPCPCSFWYRLSLRLRFYVGVTQHQGTHVSPFVLISMQRYVLFLIYSHIFLIILIFIIKYFLMY